jgi:hypothetical protein
MTLSPQNDLLFLARNVAEFLFNETALETPCNTYLEIGARFPAGVIIVNSPPIYPHCT